MVVEGDLVLETRKCISHCILVAGDVDNLELSVEGKHKVNQSDENGIIKWRGAEGREHIDRISVVTINDDTPWSSWTETKEPVKS